MDSLFSQKNLEKQKHFCFLCVFYSGRRGETIANNFEFDILMRLYSKSLFRYLYRLTNDYHLAEDLLQETFYKVYLHVSGISDIAQIKPWLYRIALITPSSTTAEKQKRCNLYKRMISLRR